MNNLVCGNRKKNYFMSDPNYHTNFHRTFLSNRNEEKTDILRRKPGHLFRLSIPELSKILMCQFWYDYVKPKYGEKAKFCCMDTDIYEIFEFI